MTETRTEEDWEHQLVRMVSEEKEDEPDAWRPCANHADNEASFRCAGCGRLLCDGCAEEKTIGGELSRFCSVCGGACNSLDELQEAKSIDSSGGTNDEAKAKAAARPLAPEPPPVDRQLATVLVFPFRGLGSITALFWVALLWAAWPLGFILFLPYIAQLHTRVEEAGPRIPAPWHLGGGAGYLLRFFVKLTIIPVLPLALCVVLLMPRTENPLIAGGETLTVTTAMEAHPVGIGAAVCILALIPLAIVLLFRTGSPFTSLDPAVLWGILKRGTGRYASLLLSLLILAAICFALFLGMKQTPVGDLSVPVIGPITPLPLCMALPGVVGLLWWTVIMALFSRWIGWMLGEESDEEVSLK